MRHRMSGAFAVLVASVMLAPGTGNSQSTESFTMVPTIAFSSARNSPCVALLPPGMQPSVAEIYLMRPDTTDVQRLTDNDAAPTPIFAGLSPDGKKIIFESNRLRSSTDPANTRLSS